MMELCSLYCCTFLCLLVSVLSFYLSMTSVLMISLTLFYRLVLFLLILLLLHSAFYFTPFLSLFYTVSMLLSLCLFIQLSSWMKRSSFIFFSCFMWILVLSLNYAFSLQLSQAYCFSAYTYSLISLYTPTLLRSSVYSRCSNFQSLMYSSCSSRYLCSSILMVYSVCMYGSRLPSLFCWSIFSGREGQLHSLQMNLSFYKILKIVICAIHPIITHKYKLNSIILIAVFPTYRLQRHHLDHLGKYQLPTPGRSTFWIAYSFHSLVPVHLLGYYRSQSRYLCGKYGLLSMSFLSRDFNPDCESMELLLRSVTLLVTEGTVRDEIRDWLLCILGSKREVLMGNRSWSMGSTCLGSGAYQSMILFCLLANLYISSWWRYLIRDLSQYRMVGVAPGMSQVYSERIIQCFYNIKPIQIKLVSRQKDVDSHLLSLSSISPARK